MLAVGSYLSLRQVQGSGEGLVVRHAVVRLQRPHGAAADVLQPHAARPQGHHHSSGTLTQQQR